MKQILNYLEDKNGNVIDKKVTSLMDTDRELYQTILEEDGINGEKKLKGFFDNFE